MHTEPITPRRRRIAIAGLAVAVTASLLMPVQAQALTIAPNEGPTAGGSVVEGVSAETGLTFERLGGFGLHSAGIGADGVAYTLGTNHYGELGNGTTATSWAPTPVAGQPGVSYSEVVTGNFHTLGVTNNGEVYAWGLNNRGQLGQGTTANSSVPVLVPLPGGATAHRVFASGNSSYALGTDGTLYSWGENSAGQLGHGGTSQADVLSATAAIQPAQGHFTEISSRGSFALGLSNDGTLYAWGSNAYGQLGDGTTTRHFAPEPVDAPGNVRFTAIAAASYHAFGIGDDGNVYGWGRNWYNVLGDGSTGEISRVLPTLVAMPSAERATAVFASDETAFALTENGTLYAWGQNHTGALGTGSTAASLTPSVVATPQGLQLTSLHPRSNGTQALAADGTVWRWGTQPNNTSVRYQIPTLVSQTTVTGVSFGSEPGTNFSATPEGWSVETPAHACGPVDVTITYSQFGEQGTRVLANGFTYGAAPEVTEQPANATIAEGESFTAHATATGDSVPTVQWERQTATGGWEPVPGQTTEELSVERLDATTTFRAVFTNCLGSVVSATATATVTPTEPLKPPVTPEPPVAPGPDPLPPSPTSPLTVTGAEGAIFWAWGRAGLSFILLGAMFLLRHPL